MAHACCELHIHTFLDCQGSALLIAGLETWQSSGCLLPSLSSTCYWWGCSLLSLCSSRASLQARLVSAPFHSLLWSHSSPLPVSNLYPGSRSSAKGLSSWHATTYTHPHSYTQNAQNLSNQLKLNSPQRRSQLPMNLHLGNPHRRMLLSAGLRWECSWEFQFRCGLPSLCL